MKGSVAHGKSRYLWRVSWRVCGSCWRTNPFEKISVSELVERAGIGRVTFYRNFSNKKEVLKRSFNMELQAWLSVRQIDLSDWTDGQLLSALRQFFDFWYEQQDNIRLLICLTGILIALVAK